jgi:hypothetical protein
MKKFFVLTSFILTLINLQAQVKGVKDINGKWGVMDASGKLIVPYIYSQVGHYGEFSEGLAEVVLNKKSGYIDTTGKVVIPLKYDECSSFKQGFGIVFLAGKCGLVDKKGILVIPCKWYLLYYTYSNLMITISSSTSKKGLITRTGKVVLPNDYDMIDNFRNGVAKITLDKKIGFVNEDGKIIIPCKYDEVRNFEEGLVAVAINKKWGYIDLGGKVVIPLQYDYVGNFKNGKTRARKNDIYVGLDKPKFIPPATAKEVLDNYINSSGGQLNLASIKNYQFTVQEFNSRKQLYYTTQVYHAGNKIYASIVENNHQSATSKTMTDGVMWVKEKDIVSKEDYEQENVFIYTMPDLLLGAEQMGYAVTYDANRYNASGFLELVVKGKGKVKTEHIFCIDEDYNLKKIIENRLDFSHTISDLGFAYKDGIRVLTEWSKVGEAGGESNKMWTVRKGFQLNVKMDDKLFVKPM